MRHFSICIVLFFLGLATSGQVAPNKFFVAFTNKNGTPYNINNPQAFLTQRAIDRRNAHGIPIVENDLPVTPSYIQQVANLGVAILNPTKWLNGVTVYASDTSVMAAIRALPFVQHVYKSTGGKKVMPQPDNKFSFESRYLVTTANPLVKPLKSATSYNYGISYTQIHQVMGDALHNAGFHGEGKMIAVLDAGFQNADIIPAFDSLRNNGQILGTKDFVLPGNNVYHEHWHGTAVLSVMGGNIPGTLVGTAPKANYWLLRSEDAPTENIIEEYNWVSAAEFADSVGADLIHSSLGYTVFDDPKYDHTCADMNGHKAPSTLGANFAASKGMAVVVSAGNEGGTGWDCMSAPADGDYVEAIAAVDASGTRASFSSVGVDTAGRVKPNLAAMGVQTVIAIPDGTIAQGDGTSFASPVISGATVCLWQSHPSVSNFDLYDVMQRSASQYAHPDSLLGYGIPDFSNAIILLKVDRHVLPVSSVFPNPFTSQLSVQFFCNSEEQIHIVLLDQTARPVLKRTTSGMQGANTLVLPSLAGLSAGIYFLRISGDDFTETRKIVKL